MSELPVISGYKIEKELGKGGMADVYLGIQENLERKVAIKILIPELFRDENFAKRFLKEARTAGQLIHPSIVTIHDVGQFKSNYYIVMEYLPASLKDKIKSGPVKPEEALAIVGKVASALDYAHGKGFIHRDIKPDNIMFREDGTPVLVDFGIARAIGSTTKLTKTGMSIGTPHYMSPEQSRGKTLDGRSDIYSLGVVLYEMLTGKVPYEAEDSDSIAIAIKHIQEPIPTLPENLKKHQPAINKMMAKEPEERIQNGKELQEMLGDTGPAHSVPKPDVETGVPKSVVEERQSIKDESKDSKPVVGDSFYDSVEYKSVGGKKGKKVLYLSLILAFLVTITIWIVVSSAKNAEENELWKTALRVDSQYYYDKYLREYPSGEHVSNAIANKNRLENERISKLQDEKDKQLRREREKAARAQRELERLRKAENARKEQERLATAKKQAEKERKSQSTYSKPSTSTSSGSYKPRVILRSSYRTLSSKERTSMLKRRGFFDKYDNKNGNFQNDFSSRVISGDRVVVDRATGLMWQQGGSSKYMIFEDAKEWVKNLNRKGYAGYHYWRLPTLEEGASLLESRKMNGDLYIDSVFSGTQKWIWTGDLRSSSSAWVVHFSFGFVHGSYLYGSFYVRAVRSGQ